MKSILDPSFKYVSSVATDIRKTFARVRREQRREKRTTLRMVKRDPATTEVAFVPPRMAKA